MEETFCVIFDTLQSYFDEVVSVSFAFASELKIKTSLFILAFHSFVLSSQHKIRKL